MNTKNRINTQAQDAQVILGIQKNLQNVPNVSLVGQTFTPASLTALIQSRIDAANLVTATRAQWLDAAAKYGALSASIEVTVRGLKQYVLNAFGAQNPLLADFGFSTPKRVASTVEQKVAAVAKRAATRKARNTLGKKAKLAIKGTVVPTVTPTPPATPPAPAAPAVPTGAVVPIVEVTPAKT